MKLFLIVIFTLVILFLQIGIFPNLKIFNVFPNIILLVIISLTILKGFQKSLGWTIAAGAFLDFYALYNVLGISIVALLIIGPFSRFLSQKFLKKENKISLIVIFFISSLVYEILLIVLFKIFNTGFNPTISALIIKSIYTSALSLPIFYTIKWYVDKIKQIQD